MIDFVFAMIAAGMNSADGKTGDATAEALSTPTPPAQVAPETPQVATTTTAPEAPTAGASASATVSMGQNVTIGSGVVIGGAGLLDGTSDQIAAPATATATAEAPVAPVAPQAPAGGGFNMAVVPPGLVAEAQNPSGKFTTATEVKPILGATKGSWVAVREYDGYDHLYVTHLFSWRCGLAAMAIAINDEPMQNWPLPPCHEQFTTPNALLEEDGLPYLRLRLKSVETIDIQIVYDDLSMDAARFERANVMIP